MVLFMFLILDNINDYQKQILKLLHWCLVKLFCLKTKMLVSFERTHLNHPLVLENQNVNMDRTASLLQSKHLKLEEDRIETKRLQYS